MSTPDFFAEYSECLRERINDSELIDDLFMPAFPECEEVEYDEDEDALIVTIVIERGPQTVETKLMRIAAEKLRQLSGCPRDRHFVLRLKFFGLPSFRASWMCPADRETEEKIDSRVSAIEDVVEAIGGDTLECWDLPDPKDDGNEIEPGLAHLWGRKTAKNVLELEHCNNQTPAPLGITSIRQPGTIGFAVLAAYPSRIDNSELRDDLVKKVARILPGSIRDLFRGIYFYSDLDKTVAFDRYHFGEQDLAALEARKEDFEKAARLGANCWRDRGKAPMTLGVQADAFGVLVKYPYMLNPVLCKTIAASVADNVDPCHRLPLECIRFGDEKRYCAVCVKDPKLKAFDYRPVWEHQ